MYLAFWTLVNPPISGAMSPRGAATVAEELQSLQRFLGPGLLMTLGAAKSVNPCPNSRHIHRHEAATLAQVFTAVTTLVMSAKVGRIHAESPTRR
jgi:hypothetical protein